MSKNATIIPIKFDEITKDINVLGKFLSQVEEDIFNFDDIKDRSEDVKVELYKIARDTYNKKLDFLIKVAELRKDIDATEASIIAFILNMSTEQKQELKKILLDLSINKKEKTS